MADLTKINEGIKLDEINYPSLDNLPNSLTGNYGFTQNKIITFQNLEQHRLFLLGKFITTVPQNETGLNGWDEIYQNAKQNGKIIVVRGAFNEIDLTSEANFGNNRSMSIIAPANDAVIRSNGYIYEVDPESLQILFPQDAQTSTKHFPNSKEMKLKDGTSIYAINEYAIKLGDLPNLVLPKSQRRASEAIIKFSESTKLVGVFSKDDLPTWAKVAQELHVKHIGKSPNLNQSAIDEIRTYTRKLGEIVGKKEEEIRQLAISTYKEINEYIVNKTGDILIPETKT